jgi:multicomponent Na+:H+ antiporter subunit D
VFLHRTGRYPAEIPSVNLDIEWLWRKALPWTAARIVAALRMLSAAAASGLAALQREGFYMTGRQSLQSALSRRWPTGSMVLWVGVFLALMLIAGLLRSLNG